MLTATPISHPSAAALAEMDGVKTSRMSATSLSAVWSDHDCWQARGWPYCC
jgi:hypothetical protein